MSKPCIVFDLDDTLYLERDYVRSGFNAVGRWADTALGLGDCAERAWRAFEAGVRGTTFQVVLTEAGCTPDTAVIDEMVRVYRNHSPVISLPADSLHCLQELRKYAVFAVITDGPADSQQAKCRSLSLGAILSIQLYALVNGDPHITSQTHTHLATSKRKWDSPFLVSFT